MRYTISGTYDGEILKNYLYKDLGLSHSAVTYLKNQEKRYYAERKACYCPCMLKNAEMFLI